MFNLKNKIYTIKFSKTRIYDKSMEGQFLGIYYTAYNKDILSNVTLFCIQNDIELRKIHINEATEKGYIKIRGTKEKYYKLIKFLMTNSIKNCIEITNLKW